MKITGDDVANQTDYSDCQNNSSPYEAPGGKYCGCSHCRIARDRIAESLAMEGTRVVDNRKVFHVQLKHKHEEFWRNSNWGNPNGNDITYSWRGTWEEACKGLFRARKEWGHVEQYRIHADV